MIWLEKCIRGKGKRKGVTASRESLSTQIEGLNEESFIVPATLEDIKEVQFLISSMETIPSST